MRSADLDVGLLLLQQHRHAAVPVPPTPVHRLEGYLLRQRRHRHRDIVLMGQLRRQGYVLVGQVQRKAGRLELPPEHRPHQALVQHPHPAQRPPPHALPDRLRLRPRLHPQGQSLGDGLPDAVADHVVHQLADGAGTDAARVEHLVPEGIQDGLDLLEDRPVAAHHHRQVARLRPRLAPAHRSVQNVGTLLPELRLDLPDQRRAAG